MMFVAKVEKGVFSAHVSSFQFGYILFYPHSIPIRLVVYLPL
jgi:hypothetical protein